jgi:hypothetical protein
MDRNRANPSRCHLSESLANMAASRESGQEVRVSRVVSKGTPPTESWIQSLIVAGRRSVSKHNLETGLCNTHGINLEGIFIPRFLNN